MTPAFPPQKAVFPQLVTFQEEDLKGLPLCLLSMAD